MNTTSTSSLFTHTTDLPTGVAGDRDVVMVGDTAQGRVVVYSRGTRQPIGELPAPEGGFVLPFILQIVGEGRVAVLTAGGMPQPKPLVPVTPVIFEYTYSVGPEGFRSELARTVQFPPESVGFPEDLVPLGQGRYLLSDAVLGRIWVVESDGSARIGIGAPPGSAPGDAPAALRYADSMEPITVAGTTFLFGGPTVPGVSGMAQREGTLYFSNPSAGAVFSVPLAVFLDQRDPLERAASITRVCSKDPAVALEQLLTLRFNPYDAGDGHLYAADSLQQRVVRIDVVTGQREIISGDPALFNFPSSISFLPPLAPRTAPSLFVVSNQQQNLTITNIAITEDQVTSPFTISQIDLPAAR